MTTQTIEPETLASVSESANQVIREVQRVYVGPQVIPELLLVSLLSRGHALLEGVPGVAKTTLCKAFAATLGCAFRRIQFTPDLLPADITGTYVLSPKEGTFELREGPIFANVVLGDEINRAPAKTQSALLEAMQEFQATIEGDTRPLPSPFIVLATQNPVEQAGTYPLPEAQMDRFLMKISVPYPETDAELAIVRLLQREEGQQELELEQIPQAHIFAARETIQAMQLSAPVEQYIVDLVIATRAPGNYGDRLAHWVDTGSSPRASIALHRASRASAWLDGRDQVTPEDVVAVAHAVLRHRMILSYDALADHVTPDDVIDELIAQVAVG